ncbi:hypothetical protein JCM6882_000273 [Rhodosporidiobolus microsporus]
MAPSYALNDDPFAAPDFLAGLEAAGYLQRLDTSEERITARYQHALAKMSFAAHSEEFLARAGVKKVHRSTVQFFNEAPVSDPFVHVLVGSLPPSRQELITPRGCETSGWTPIRSEQEAAGTRHFTVSHDGFWPMIVVFDTNHDMDKEDKYAGIRYDNESDSDLEGYLAPSRSRRVGMGGSQYGGAGGAGGSGYYSSSGRAGRARRGSYAAGAGDSSSSSGSEDEGAGGRGQSRYGDGTRSQRGGMSRSGSYYANDGTAASGSGAYGGGSARRSSRRQNTGMSAADMNEAMSNMALGRSASRAGSQADMGTGRSASRAQRRNSMAASGAGY